MTTTTAYVQAPQSTAARSSGEQGRRVDVTAVALGLGALAAIGFAAVATVAMAVLL